MIDRLISGSVTSLESIDPTVAASSMALKENFYLAKDPRETVAKHAGLTHYAALCMLSVCSTCLCDPRV